MTPYDFEMEEVTLAILRVVDSLRATEPFAIAHECKEAYCLQSAALEAGVKELERVLQIDDKATTVGMRRAVMFFDHGANAYRVHRLEYQDGNVIHVA